MQRRTRSTFTSSGSAKHNSQTTRERLTFDLSGRPAKLVMSGRVSPRTAVREAHLAQQDSAYSKSTSARGTPSFQHQQPAEGQIWRVDLPNGTTKAVLLCHFRDAQENIWETIHFLQSPFSARMSCIMVILVSSASIQLMGQQSKTYHATRSTLERSPSQTRCWPVTSIVACFKSSFAQSAPLKLLAQFRHSA